MARQTFQAARAICMVLATAAQPTRSLAADGLTSPSNRPSAITAFVQEAAARFNLSTNLIWTVIAAESGGDPHAISTRGALGLMQLMPRTYAELRLRYGLGGDVFAPRDNILAGAAYLREMDDRFGPSGVLAAYNAGPERYADHLLTGAPLPRSTQAYVARLAPRLGLPLTAPVSLDRKAQTMAPVLFVAVRDHGQISAAAPASALFSTAAGLFVEGWPTAPSP